MALKKLLLAGIIGILLLPVGRLMAATAGKENTAELLSNNSFEELTASGSPKGWKRFTDDHLAVDNEDIKQYGNPSNSTVSQDAHSGKNSVLIDIPEGKKEIGGWSTRVTIKPGSAYVLTYWAKAEGKTFSGVKVEGYGTNGKRKNIACPAIEYSDAWKEYRLEFESKPEITGVLVTVFTWQSSGKFWVDDISLKKFNLIGVQPDETNRRVVKLALVSVEGAVFLDRNHNNKQDPDESGIKNVVVSDGLQAVRTDARGHYVLPKVDPVDRRFVFVVTPSGYRNVDSFYRSVLPSSGPPEISFALSADPETSKADFSFIQMTDIHVTDAAVARELLDVLNQMLPLRPAFVVATGDLVEDGKIPLQFENYSATIRRFPLPIFNVPGNHDIIGFSQTGGSAKDNYAKTVGPERYAFDYGGRHFLILNCIDDIERQYQWMKKELELQPPDKEILVFQHYPPDARLMKFLERYNTRAIFSGHRHSSRVFQFGKILYVNTPTALIGGIDVSPPASLRVSFQGKKMVLDDIFPGIGTREAWVAAIKRPTPEADAPAPVTHEDWPMFQHDSSRTGITGDQVKPPLRLAWRRTLEGTIHGSSPVVVGQTVYIGVADEENRGYAGVYALDAATGAVKWRFTASSSLKNSVSVANNLVYGATVEGNVFALDAATGKCRWQYSLGNPLLDNWTYSSPLVAGQVLYAGAGPVFVALDALEGKLLWTAKSLGGQGISCRASPALGDGMVFVGFNGSNGLFALDAKTGKERWNDDGGPFSTHHAAPSYSGKMLYDASAGKLHALDVENGKEQWNFAVAGWGLSSPAVEGNIVLIGGTDGRIFGLDRTTGKQRWVYEKTEPTKFRFAPYEPKWTPVISSPAVSGKTAYIGTTDGRFLALNTDTGQELWGLGLGAPVTSSAAVSGNAVYIASYDGTVYAFVTTKQSEIKK